jgi:hypothetical protein
MAPSAGQMPLTALALPSGGAIGAGITYTHNL